MNLVERAKEIILQPQAAWEKIKGEETTIKDLYTSYACILALIPAIANFIGMSLIGSSFMGISFRVPIGTGLVQAILQYVLTLVGIYVVAFIIDALAPSFDSKKNMVAAMKVAVYASTPAWIAGILGIIPMLGVLAIIASLYGLYLFYVGLPILMETPKEKVLGYFIVVIVVAIIVSVLVGVFAGLVVSKPASMMIR
jgi:uncharacterized membrane protein